MHNDKQVQNLSNKQISWKGYRNIRNEKTSENFENS